jgi:peptidoglycan/LPS O-acetylase OafA/YrhL
VTKIGGRIAAVDSLRGWAAAYVILYHMTLIPSPALRVPEWASPVVLAGGTGVTLFFVTSAFSLCLAARPGEERGRALAAFAMRRFFRIAPLFYVILLVSLLRDTWVFSATHDPAIIAANMAFVFNLLPGQETGIVWASWTIGVEVLFYCVFPFLVARARSLSHASALVLLALLIAMAYPELLRRTNLTHEAQQTQIQYGVLRHLPVFTFGILTYRIFERLFERDSPPRAAGAALLLGAAYLYMSLLGGRLGSWLLHDAYYWQAVSYGAVILGSVIYPARFLVNRATRHLGKISYSLYLIHPLLVLALIPFYRWVESHDWLRTLTFCACTIVTLGIAIAVATLTHALIETPGMRLGSRLAARLTRGPPRRVVGALR